MAPCTSSRWMPRIHADAVALAPHSRRGDIGKAGQGVLILFALFSLGGGLFVQTVAAGREHGRVSKREGPRRSDGPAAPVIALGGAHIAHAHRVALVGQVTGEGQRHQGVLGKQVMAYPCARSGSGPPQGGQVAVPVGDRKGLGIDKVFRFEPRSCRAQDSRTAGHALLLAAMTRSSMVWYSTSARAEHAAPPSRPVSSSPRRNSSGLLGIADASPTSSRMNRGVQMIQQGGRFGCSGCHVLSMASGIRPESAGTGRLRWPFPARCSVCHQAFLLQRHAGLGSLFGAAEQHLAGRRER